MSKICVCERPIFNPNLLPTGFIGIVQCYKCEGVVKIPDLKNRQVVIPDSELYKRKNRERREADAKLRAICSCGKFKPGEEINKKTYCKNCEGYKLEPQKVEQVAKPPTMLERIIAIEKRLDKIERE